MHNKPEPESIEALDGSLYATMYVKALAHVRLALRKIETTLVAAVEDVEHAIRIEMENANRYELKFPTFTVKAKKAYRTFCTCHDVAAHLCPDGKKGEPIYLKVSEFPREIEVKEYTPIQEAKND